MQAAPGDFGRNDEMSTITITPSFKVKVNNKRPKIIKGSPITLHTLADLPPLPGTYLRGEERIIKGYDPHWVFLGIDILAQLRRETIGTVFGDPQDA